MATFVWLKFIFGATIPEGDCKLELREQRVMHKGKEVVKVGENGNLQWLEPSLKPTEEEEKAMKEGKAGV